MLKDLFDLQNTEVAEKAVLDEKKASSEFKQLRELKAEFAREKENYLRIEKELESLNSQLAVFPQQIRELEEKIAQENKAIYDGSVVNVKELAAREAQAATLAERLQELQSLNALYLGEYEQKSAENEDSKRKISEYYQRFSKIKAEYQKMLTIWQEKLDVLAVRKQEIMSGISQKDLLWFESVKGKCNGTPVAMLSIDHVCSGCHTIVPPITFKRTCMGQTTFCEKCGRTLFVIEMDLEGAAQQSNKTTKGKTTKRKTTKEKVTKEKVTKEKTTKGKTTKEKKTKE